MGEGSGYGGPILIQHRCLWELLALDPTILGKLVSWRLLLCLLRADVLKVSVLSLLWSSALKPQPEDL